MGNKVKKKTLSAKIYTNVKSLDVNNQFQVKVIKNYIILKRASKKLLNLFVNISL